MLSSIWKETLMKYDEMFMEMANVVSKQSHDSDHKVGAIIVKDDRVISMGWNGMPPGMDNNCKHATGATRKEVIHAEANAIAYLARSTASSEGATIYCTLSPCIDCAKLIVQAGITRVVFGESYKDESGKLFLMERLGIDNISRLSCGEDPRS